jgi:hypothetical protein
LAEVTSTKGIAPRSASDLHALQQLHAGHARHAQVAETDGRPQAVFQLLPRIGAIFRFHNVELAAAVDQMHQHHARDDIIVHYQNFHVTPCAIKLL